MASESAQPRTAFQGRKKNIVVSVFFLLVSLGVLGLAPVPWIGATSAIDYVLSVVLVLVGLVGLLVAVVGIQVWRRPVWAGLQYRRDRVRTTGEPAAAALVGDRLDGAHRPRAER